MTGWPIVALGEVASISRRAVDPAALAPETDYVGLEHIPAGGGQVRKSTLGDHDVTSTKFAFDDRHVLFGKLRPNLGKVAWPGYSGVCSTDILPILPEGCLDAGFLAWFLRRPQTTAWAAGRAAGASLPRLSPSELSKLPIPVPPISEQRRIAAILDQADSLRTKRREVEVHLGQLPRSIYSYMFEAAASAHWPVRPLEEVVRRGTSVTYGIVQAGDEYPDGVPYIRTGDIQNGEIAVGRLRRTDPAIAARFERSRVEPGDVVMSIRATVGTTALVPPSLAGANLTQGTARISPGPTTLPTFLLEQIRSPRVQRWIQSQVKGATFREITLGRLRELPVVVPPIAMQREFADQIAAIGRMRTWCAKSAEGLEALFRSLEARGFKGEL